MIPVAAVGDQKCLIGQDQEQPCRSGEAGQVLNVGQFGDEEAVAAELAKTGHQPRQAAGDVHVGREGLGHEGSPSALMLGAGGAGTATGDETCRCLDGELISEPSETGHRSISHRRHNRPPAPRFSGIWVRKMNLDDHPVESG